MDSKKSSRLHFWSGVGWCCCFSCQNLPSSIYAAQQGHHIRKSSRELLEIQCWPQRDANPTSSWSLSASGLMMQNWHVKLGGLSKHIPKRRPEMTCKLQLDALMCFQKGQHSPPAPHPRTMPCPWLQARTQFLSQLPQLKSFYPREEDATGCCRVRRHCCPSCPSTQCRIPCPSSLLNIPLCCTASREIMGQPSVFPGEEKQTQETPQGKQSFRTARCGGGRCAPSPRGIIPGADPTPSFPQLRQPALWRIPCPTLS